MSNKIEIKSSVEGGRLKRNRKAISNAIKSFEGKEIEIIIRRARKQRSNQQNRYLWGCVYPILQSAFKDLGHRISIDEVHAFIKDHLMSINNSIIVEEIVIEETAQVLKRVKSTTELTPTEFNEYVFEIQEWASQTLGINIPDPNEQLTINQ